ncbi:MAG: hypothetical protein HFJ35_03175 [Clostridia bacterium]|nr:hypothetical protein [Clostridia bacterium]
MNFKTELSINNQKLLQEIGYKIENREYSPEEIKNCEIFIANHIMSQSSKNNNIANETIKFNDLINILVKNEK